MSQDKNAKTDANAKKDAKKPAAAKTTKNAQGEELSEEELEGVSGGPTAVELTMSKQLSNNNVNASLNFTDRAIGGGGLTQP